MFVFQQCICVSDGGTRRYCTSRDNYDLFDFSVDRGGTTVPSEKYIQGYSYCRVTTVV